MRHIVISYTGLKQSQQPFLVKTRCFSDNGRDSLDNVLMDIYFRVVLGSLCKNVDTSLNASLPFDETVIL